MRRTQIYLDDVQRDTLTVLAQERGVTASAIIREAIDRFIAEQLSPEDKLQRLRELGTRFSAASTDHASTDSASTDPARPGCQDTEVVVDELRAADADRLRSLA